MPQLIDSHCHFDSEQFSEDRTEVFRRALDAGITAIISPAITAASWPALKQIAAAFDVVNPCYGLHPMFTNAHQPTDLEELENWIHQESPVAIGECGLDFYQGKEDSGKQLEIFDGQLALAAKYDLPVIIHARRAVEEVLRLLRRYPEVSGVLHSYSGSAEQARQLAARDIYFGFGGPVTWPQSRKLHKLVAKIPLDRILLETDAPDQAGEQHRRQRNEPAFLPEIAEKIAAIKQFSPDTVAAVTTKNATRLFRLKRPSQT